jgi:methylase of polypeptide subunit release factors
MGNKGLGPELAAAFAKVEKTIELECGVGADDARRFTQILFIRLIFARLVGQAFGPASILTGKFARQTNVPHFAGGLFDPSPLDRLVPNLPDLPDPGRLLDDSVLTSDLLGHILEERLPNRHRTGSYYTPAPIVSFMCRQALKGYLAQRTSVPHERIRLLIDRRKAAHLTPAHTGQLLAALRSLKALDPACGCGAFLLGLLDELLSLHRLLDPSGLSLPEIKRHILTHTLHGIDLDPIAAHITILRLWLSLADKPPRLRFNIRAADALLDDHPAGSGPFDIILTNPPYLSTKHGFAHGNLRALRSRYTTARGHFDAYTLFLERALQLLRPGVGHFSYIVPKPILTNANMRPIRELLARHTLHTIADPGAVFPAAAVEPIIIVGAKTRAQTNAQIQIIPRHAFIKSNPNRKRLADLVTSAGTWNIATSPRGGTPDTFPRLGDLFTITRGIESGKRDPAIHNQNGDGSHPLLRGEDLTPYHIHFASHYIHRNGNAAKFKPAPLYAPPSLLVRRVATDLIAAVDHRGYHVLNTIYVLKPRPACPVSLEYACAVLNSTWANTRFHELFVNDDRLFPYIRKHQLASVPVPVPPPEVHEQICTLVGNVAQAIPIQSMRWRQKIDALVHRCARVIRRGRRPARTLACASASPAHARGGPPARD